MTTVQSADDLRFFRRVTESAIRLVLLFLLVAWCLVIIRPFLVPVVWGAVLAIAVGPLHVRLTSLLGGRRKIAAGLMLLIALAGVLVPAYLFIESAVQGALDVSHSLSEGKLVIPLPPEGVAEWPVIGERLSSTWELLAEDTSAVAGKYLPQIRSAAEWVLAFALGLGLDVAMLAFAGVLAAVFLSIGDRTERPAEALGMRLAGDRGKELVHLVVQTIQSVARGVVGTAAIQGFFGGAGMLVVGVPGAGLWALVILILAVIQLSPFLVLGPAAFWVFSTQSTAVAVLFLIWSIVVGVSDTFLKPVLFGRGAKVPMLVILIGAIGGMLTSGIIGLFLGAVVLSVGHQLFMAWLHEEAQEATLEEGQSTG